jgi:hypothetical protein
MLGVHAVLNFTEYILTSIAQPKTVRHHAGLFACPKRNLLHRTGYKSGVYMSSAMALRSFVELYEQLYLVTEQYDQ